LRVGAASAGCGYAFGKQLRVAGDSQSELHERGVVVDCDDHRLGFLIEEDAAGLGEPPAQSRAMCQRESVPG
jgi:hypothetical protein